MSLRDEILAGGFDLSNRDDGAIAAALSAGRKKLVSTEIGNGTVLEVLGIQVGNALLRTIRANPDFEFVTPLLEQGRLRIDSSLVRCTLDALAQSQAIPGFGHAEAEKLKAVALVDDIVTPQQVAKALEGM